MIRANVRPFAYDKAGKKGCSFFLDSVQFLRPGQRLDGRKPAAEQFPDDAENEDRWSEQAQIWRERGMRFPSPR